MRRWGELGKPRDTRRQPRAAGLSDSRRQQPQGPQSPQEPHNREPANGESHASPVLSSRTFKFMGLLTSQTREWRESNFTMLSSHPNNKKTKLKSKQVWLMLAVCFIEPHWSEARPFQPATDHPNALRCLAVFTWLQVSETERVSGAWGASPRRRGHTAGAPGRCVSGGRRRAGVAPDSLCSSLLSPPWKSAVPWGPRSHRSRVTRAARVSLHAAQATPGGGCTILVVLPFPASASLRPAAHSGIQNTSRGCAFLDA